MGKGFGRPVELDAVITNLLDLLGDFLPLKAGPLHEFGCFCS